MWVLLWLELRTETLRCCYAKAASYEVARRLLAYKHVWRVSPSSCGDGVDQIPERDLESRRRGMQETWGLERNPVGR